MLFYSQIVIEIVTADVSDVPCREIRYFPLCALWPFDREFLGEFLYWLLRTALRW
jgi:hypothetical protein